MEPRSTIFSHCWGAYCSLNDLGYNNLIVIYKYTSTKVYISEITKGKVKIHTNRIGAPWKHAKEHFRRMSGTKSSNPCEIMWTSEVKLQVYDRSFQVSIPIFPRKILFPAEYTYPTPFVQSWSGLDCSIDIGQWEIKPLPHADKASSGRVKNISKKSCLQDTRPKL